MMKFYIHTMGCKSNQFESAIIKENLIKNGIEEVNNIEDANIFILNSCTVTHKSDNEAFYLLRNAKNKNKNIKTILTGCIAQVEKEKLLQKDFIDIVIGNDEKLKMFEILNELQTDNMHCAVADIMTLAEFNKQVLEDTTKTRASLKIQDGCDNRCSYCIIPYARGKSRSADIDFIIEQINKFSSHGFKEVVFTGIHIGQWGKDIGLELLDLLKAVEEKTTIERYRLGSLNPLEITNEMLEFLKHSKKFCPHFHLSLQSACNKTLKSMNRFYTVEYYLKQIEQINQTFDMPFLGSDIIAGFAGETEEDFETTRINLEKSGLTQIHTFPYSIREGTIGAKSTEQLDDKTKEQRAEIIKEISRKKHENFIKNNIGKIREILIEKHPDKKTGLLKGVTRNYLTVITNTKDETLFNSLVNVKITKLEQGKIYGEII
ncbi:tRNA (N(6)-L-threonylcarbamoyladenosine(37)-C(2))-methylthiotransferase MtaB [bacterium]|nr:tRNA (N(6)-L-threonylcarbamoyladenosine(37)-C(2))-methylthiotransferase MtaB [bacterium]